MNTLVTNSSLELNLGRAADGERSAMIGFYKALFSGPLFVPERYQAQSLSHIPTYPNDLFNIMGIADQDRVVTPVFADPKHIQEWCGQELKYRTFNGQQLLELVPKEWWLCIEPGLEVYKEMSPWELDQLRDGDAGIEAIVDELCPEIVQMVETRPLKDSEHAELKFKLRATASKIKAVTNLYILNEESRDHNGQVKRTVLIGVQVDSKDSKELEDARDKIKSISDLCLVGEESAKIFCGSSFENNIALGIFKDCESFYKRALDQGKKSPLAKVISLFKK